MMSYLGKFGLYEINKKGNRLLLQSQFSFLVVDIKLITKVFFEEYYDDYTKSLDGWIVTIKKTTDTYSLYFKKEEREVAERCYQSIIYQLKEI